MILPIKQISTTHKKRLGYFVHLAMNVEILNHIQSATAEVLHLEKLECSYKACIDRESLYTNFFSNIVATDKLIEKNNLQERIL